MSDYRLEYKLSELEKGVNDLKKGVDSIKDRVTFSDHMWDNFELTRNWHVSPRTLASWRAKQLIDYVKVGRKIYYSKQDRDRFLSKFHIDNVR